MTAKITKRSVSILENHKVFKYEFDNVQDALDKMDIFRRYKEIFLNRHPSFRMLLKFKPLETKTILTVEIWTFPRLLNN